MINNEKITFEEFVDKLKKSKYIIFYTEYDDVKNFINGYGNTFNIVKVKKGIVITKINGLNNPIKFKVDFLKYWLDEYKLKIE